MQVASPIAQHMNKRKVVITKSTVPVGTTDKVLAHIKDILRTNKQDLYNPAYMEELGIEYYGIGRGLSLLKQQI